MIKVEGARQLIFDRTEYLEKYRINLSKGITYCLAEDIFSPISMPPFRQSAMDGYALNLTESNTRSYSLVGEIKAGDNYNPELKKGQAVRIFTGAPVPDSANAVVMQEKVNANGKTITIDSPVAERDNIRPVGEQIQKGRLALEKGTQLNAAAIGYLASLGISEIEVYKKPRIAVVITGDELCKAGENLDYGKIYESNGIMLASALNGIHFTDVSTFRVADDYQSTYKLLDQAISEHDVVIITGGISVGDYDYVGSVLQDLSVEQIFYKVRQKPGKPLFFGKKGNTSIFALPGNPAAALSCFYVYVWPALQKMSGDPAIPHLVSTMVKSNSNYIKKGDRAQFLKAILNEKGVTILKSQGSAMLQTFALANVLVYLPEEQGDIHIGDTVQIIPLPN